MSRQTVGTHDLIDLQLQLEWQSDFGRHQEIRHFPNYNVWRDLDLLPAGLQPQILGQPSGHIGSMRIAAGEWVPEHEARLVHRVRAKDFQPTIHGREIVPRLGRFYPQGMVANLPGVFSDSVFPLRIVAMDDKYLSCDLNHPLAGRELTLTCRINGIHGAPEEHGGRCQDGMAQLLRGPGMQVRAGRQATDFFSGEPFRRMDERPDSTFYSMSRLVDHLDARALQEMAGLYARVLPVGARILDLMASVDSHMVDGLQPVSVVGLGMNREELDANPRLNERLVHDLNRDPGLPFADASFDAVVCSVSVEYLTDPLAVFAEVWRVLAPGGVFINSFSNRWFPPKVINLWIDLHEFERMGLVGGVLSAHREFRDPVHLVPAGAATSA